MLGYIRRFPARPDERELGPTGVGAGESRRKTSFAAPTSLMGSVSRGADLEDLGYGPILSLTLCGN